MIDDYDGYDDSDAETVDSDDDEIKFVGSNRRFKYTTFGDNSEDVDEGDDGKESSIYGVFAESNRNSKGDKFSSKPMFVKASSKNVNNSPPEKDENRISNATEPSEKSAEDDDLIKAEKKLRKEQEAANQEFIALLNRGKGRKRPRISFERETPVEDAMPGRGLGFTQDNANSNTESSDKIDFHQSKESTIRSEDQASEMTINQFTFQSSNQPPRVKSNLGKWEKHTKGIGMKLLSKMGYSGSGGLGSKRKRGSAGVEKTNAATGISRPVEVVVRPQNLGLGFGNFKEATNLKANKQIGAEIRGEKLLEKTADDAMKRVSGNTQSSSSLPSTDVMLRQKPWRRGAKNLSKKKGEKIKIVPFTEVIKEKQTTGIIDMRGPPSNNAEIQLGEELLFNTSTLLNNYESKVRLASHFLNASKQKMNSLQSDFDRIEERKKLGNERVSQMKSVLQVVDSINDMITNADPDLSSNTQALVHTLREKLSEEDRSMLQFDKVLVPSLLSPLINTSLDSWKPLHDGPEKAQNVLKSLLDVACETDDAEVAKERRISIFSRDVLPKIKASFESSKWNPMAQVEEAVTLYEIVLNSSKKSLTAKENYTSDECAVFSSVDVDEERLGDLVPRELLRETIFPKLMRFLHAWKAELDANLNVQNRLELWLLPWISHLDHRTIITQLASDLKRKVRSTLSVLNREILKHDEFLRTSMAIIKPWKTLLRQEVIYDLTSKYITPRFIKALSGLNIVHDVGKQNWLIIDTILSTYNASLIEDIEFSSALEGVLLSAWIHKLHELLNSNEDKSIETLATFYQAWKLRLFTTDRSTPSYQLLQVDNVICRIFFTGLKMIEMTLKGKPGDKTSEVQASSCKKYNYHNVLNRRRHEKWSKNEDDLDRALNKDTMEFQKQVMTRRYGGTATFREVVEDFCLNEAISFRPKTGGKDRTDDGNPIFLFENVPIYLDANVIFAKDSGKWAPISLEQLTSMVKNKH